MKRIERIAQMRTFADAGLTVRQAAEEAGIKLQTVYVLAEKNDISFVRQRTIRRHAGQSASMSSRTELMVAQFRGGRTLQQIGDEFGLTRERVRQCISQYADVTRFEGGACIRAQRNNAKRIKERERRAVDLHGCTLAQVDRLRGIGAQMMAVGKGRYRTPLYAFRSQRNAAANRSIEWNLSLWDWWTIWEQSGKWDQRGRGQGYVMCRYGDVGAYEIGNVFIDLAIRNCSHKPSKKSKLPTGVSKHGRRFVAHRMIAGVKLRLGTFDTPEKAFEAYLSASNSPVPVKAEAAA